MDGKFLARSEAIKDWKEQMGWDTNRLHGNWHNHCSRMSRYLPMLRLSHCIRLKAVDCCHIPATALDLWQCRRMLPKQMQSFTPS